MRQNFGLQLANFQWFCRLADLGSTETVEPVTGSSSVACGSPDTAATLGTCTVSPGLTVSTRTSDLWHESFHASLVSPFGSIRTCSDQPSRFTQCLHQIALAGHPASFPICCVEMQW